MRRWGFNLLVATCFVLVAQVHAQDGPTAQQRQQAAQAYDRAAALYVDGNYAQAGQWFMTAYRLAPARAALVQAVRAYRAARQIDRAGTLAILLADQFPNDPAAVELASQVMEAAGRRTLLVTVDCEGCEVEIDGRMLNTRAAYVSANERHRVVGHFGRAQVEASVSGGESEQEQVHFDRPEGAEVQEEELTEGERERRNSGMDTRTEEGSGRQVLPPAVFYSALGVTVALGALTTWSGVDTLSGVDAYEDNPTAEGLSDGQDKERRTNILLGVTLGMAAVSIVTLILTKFGGDDDEDDDEASAAIVPSHEGVAFVYSRSL